MAFFFTILTNDARSNKYKIKDKSAAFWDKTQCNFAEFYPSSKYNSRCMPQSLTSRAMRTCLIFTALKVHVKR